MAHAQTVSSPSDGCVAANTGVYDLVTTDAAPVASGTISETFVAGEVLTFAIDANGDIIDAGVVEDETAGATVLNSATETSVDYTAPADGIRNFSLFLDKDEGNATLTVSCAAAPQGSITIVKDYGAESGNFGFSGDLGAFSIAVSAAPASQLFSSLSPGVYSVSETLTQSSNLQSISCTGDLDAGSVINLESGSVNIDLDDGEDVTCTFVNGATSINPTTTDIDDNRHSAIRNFLYHRAGAILSSEPDRARLLRKSTGVLTSNGIYKLSARADTDGADVEIAAKMTPAQAKNLDLWVEGHYTRFEYDNGPNFEGDVGVLYVGADYLATKNVVLGVVSQFDWTTEKSAALGENTSGHGWMFGPYVSARLSKNLFFDARSAWGRSSNDLFIAGYGIDDEFKTNRWLLRGGLTGNKQFGDWRVTPSVSIAYFEEEQKDYYSSAGLLVAEQTVALGRVTFEPEFAYQFVTGSGVLIEPQFSIAGLWDFETPDDLSIAGWTIGTDKFRLQASGGMQVVWPTGLAVRASTFYDGLASRQFESYGVRLWLNIPLRSARSAKRRDPLPLVSTPPMPVQAPPRSESAEIEFAEAKANLSSNAYAALEALWAKAGGEEIEAISIEASGADADIAARRGKVLRDALVELGAPSEAIDITVRLEPSTHVSRIRIGFR